MYAPVGAASAVKICQSGVTRGYTALTSIVVLAAMRFGAGETLRAELMTSRPGHYEILAPATGRMFDKAHRYGGEMEEIAAFLGEGIGGPEVLRAFSEVYGHLASDVPEAQRDVELLKAFYGDTVKGKAKAN